MLGSLFGGALGLAGQAMNEAATKRLMQQQQVYNLQNMGLQYKGQVQQMGLSDKYQRDLLRDYGTLSARSLKAAGSSIAGLGDSFSAPSSNVANGGPSLPSAPTGGNVPMVDFLQGAKLKAEIDNITANTNNQNADTKKKLKETDWLDETNNANVKYLYAIGEKAEQEISNLKEELHKIVAETDVVREKKREISANVDKLMAETDSVKINNQFLADINDSKIKQVKAETLKALAEKDFTKVRESWARLGIGVSSSWIESIASLSAGGQGELVDKVISNIETSFKNMLESVPKAMGSMLGSSYDKAIEFLNWLSKKLGYEK